MRRLARRLRESGRDVVETSEPGGTAIGRQIRSILLGAQNSNLTPAAELLLYFASRAQNVEEVIWPALAQGKIVLSDRFTDSSLAYQGCARGLGAGAILALDHIACRGLEPDLTLLIEIDLETSLERARARNRDRQDVETRMDDQSLEFYSKVRDAYRALAAAHPARIQMIDGRADIAAVERQIWSIVSPRV